MLNDKCGMNETLSLDSKMFPVFNGQEIDKLGYFTHEELTEIKTRINDYELCKSRGNPQSHRGGGSQLAKEIALIANYKEKLLEHIAVMRDILSPREKTRTTVKQVETATNQAAIHNVAVTFNAMDSISLRKFAEIVLGDIQLTFTPDELPLVIATKQISGILLEPGKVV